MDDVGGLRLDDVGEEGLLARLLPLLAAAPAEVGPGDDAAVVRAPDGRVVVTTDVLVEGRDFRRDWSSAEDVGWKAAAQNLADVAAMGARPTGLVVGLAAPGELEVEWALGLGRGLAAACAALAPSCGVVGGDLSGAGEVVVSVTALGDLGGRPPLLRSGARVGDVVVHVGVLGWSAAGLAVLLAEGAPPQAALAAPGRGAALAAHRRPRPPVAAGPALAVAGAGAAIDVSDGLLRDAGRLARASGVVLDLRGDALRAAAEPLEPLAHALGEDPLSWVLSGGEDHGLLACLPPEAAGAAPGAVVLGAVVAVQDGGGPGVLVDGRPARVAGTGWDHFGG